MIYGGLIIQTSHNFIQPKLTLGGASLFRGIQAKRLVSRPLIRRPIWGLGFFVGVCTLPCQVVLAVTKIPYCVVRYMQSITVVLCFICKVSLLSSVLYAKYRTM